MRKYVAIFIAVLIISPNLAFASFETNLKYGSKGDAVIELQEFLTDQGIYTGPITGNFFSLTLRAVKNFQSAQGLPSTGYFGPMSRNIALSLIAPDIQSSDTEEKTETGINSVPVANDPIKNLVDQVTQLSQQQAETNQKLGVIIQPMPEKQVSTPASIEVQTVPFDPNSTTPFGQYYFNVGVKFTDGSTKDSSQVSVVWPSDQSKDSQDAANATKQTTQQGFLGKGVHSIQFGPYIPTSLGTKTITFTSGNLSQSVTVEVK